MHGTLNNDTLLLLVAKGDREAFRALYRATASVLFAVCLGILRDRTTAQDVLQEAFVRVRSVARRWPGS
jgi:RNA polymerase sigma-70 factor (ECF subfamily)